MEKVIGANCSFCLDEIKGKEPLQRNKISFWTENEIDKRIICNNCLRKNKKVLKYLGIKGVKRQMLYNYRMRGLI